MQSVDTIYAPATGGAGSALSVIRISGPDAHSVLNTLIGGSTPASRVLSRRWLLDADQSRIDDAMVVRFEAGASFTGEAMAEIHCHGSRAVLNRLSERLSSDLGCRIADPGEFARRAFENGRMDLSEAEGLADLIAAETELQRQQAMRMMSGELTQKVEAWRANLLRACALIEVSIDWVDEDVPVDVRPEVKELIDALVQELRIELSRSATTQRMRAGFEVAIIGAPNSGKSTLLNHLAGREAAIVSDIPGTTRDVIELRYDLDGIPVVFLDTAGIRETTDAIEEIGVARAVERAEGADLRLFMTSIDQPDRVDFGGLTKEGDISTRSKSDLGSGFSGLAISVKTGEGIDRLLQMISEKLSERSSGAGVLSQIRHEQAVSDAVSILEELQPRVLSGDFEILAQEMRTANRLLEGIVGRIDTDTILDNVFGSFCLGK